mgnify:CR=1 FL=1
MNRFLGQGRSLGLSPKRWGCEVFWRVFRSLPVRRKKLLKPQNRGFGTTPRNAPGTNPWQVKDASTADGARRGQVPGGPLVEKVDYGQRPLAGTSSVAALGAPPEQLGGISEAPI